MPDRLICVIDDTFHLSGRSGLVVVPGLAPDQGRWLRLGARLKAIRPDRTVFATELLGFEMVSRRKAGAAPTAILIRGTKTDVPVGSELVAVLD